MQNILSGDKLLAYRNDNDFFKDVFYDGKPFTGIVKDGNEVTSYFNGNANGDYYCYTDGRVYMHDIYENGEQVESTSYHPSGAVKTIYNSKGVKMWSDEGVLVMEGDAVIRTHYFTNGKIKSISDKGNGKSRQRFFAQNGDLVMTELPDEPVNGKRNVSYEKALEVHYYTLLHEDAGGLESDQVYQMDETHRSGLIWMWFWAIFEQDKNAYFGILNHLLIHPDIKIKREIAGIIAIHKFDPFIEAENSANEACYQMIRESRAHQDKYYPDRDHL